MNGHLYRVTQFIVMPNGGYDIRRPTGQQDLPNEVALAACCKQAHDDEVARAREFGFVAVLTLGTAASGATEKAVWVASWPRVDTETPRYQTPGLPEPQSIQRVRWHCDDRLTEAEAQELAEQKNAAARDALRS